jgi:N-acyl homoserine lactone hydrolase
VADIEVRRVDFGYFVRPADETGTGSARVEPCLGYLVDHPDGLLLFDTGMGSDPDVDEHYHPHRTPLGDALRAVAARPDDVTHVANCHLHVDHCGGNPDLRGRPVLVQSVELAEATGTPDYTLPELLEGGAYDELEGEAEVFPGVWLVPTPGHTPGHQSLVVRRADGTVVLAGQSHETASHYAADELGRRARLVAAGVPEAPTWMDRLADLDPRVVYFAHDRSVWVP